MFAWPGIVPKRHNVAAALKLGRNVIALQARGHRLTINGRVVPFKNGTTALPGGGKVVIHMRRRTKTNLTKSPLGECEVAKRAIGG